MLRVQHLVGHANRRPRALTTALRAFDNQALLDWAFGHYLAIAPPEFATAPPAVPARPPALVTA